MSDELTLWEFYEKHGPKLEVTFVENRITVDGIQIATWHSDYSAPKFHAVNISKAMKMLEEYELSEEEKSSLMELMAGYCMMLDDARLIGYGETEIEAINDLANKSF